MQVICVLLDIKKLTIQQRIFNYQLVPQLKKTMKMVVVLLDHVCAGLPSSVSLACSIGPITESFCCSETKLGSRYLSCKKSVEIFVSAIAISVAGRHDRASAL